MAFQILAYTRITFHKGFGLGFSGSCRSNHGHGRWIRWVYPPQIIISYLKKKNVQYLTKSIEIPFIRLFQALKFLIQMRNDCSGHVTLFDTSPTKKTFTNKLKRQWKPNRWKQMISCRNTRKTNNLNNKENVPKKKKLSKPANELNGGERVR